MPDPLIQVVLPEMGESVTEGTITGWRKAVGDRVEPGEALVDVTTDKVDVEVPAPSGGTLVKIVAPDGATVAVGALLAELSASADVAAQSTPTPNGASTTGDRPTPIAPPPIAAATAPLADRDASPLARRMAARNAVDLSHVQGSGPGGAIRRQDILEAAGAPTAPAPSAAPSNAGTRTLLKGPAASLAAAMEKSLAIPTATSFRTLPVDTLDAKRRELVAALKTAGRPEKISFTHLIAFAISRAAVDVPSMAASFQRTEAGPERVAAGIHLGIAVDMTRKDGSRFLIVPVIRDAGTLDFKSFHEAYESLVVKARANAVAPDDLTGATITLTNPGAIGTVASVPRLMPNQGTIVAAGAIGYPPGLATANEASLRSIGVSKVMTLTSTYDHRVIQGAESGEFLRRIEQLLGGASGFYDSIFRDLQLASGAAIAERPAASTGVGSGITSNIDVLMRAAGAGAALVSRFRTHGHILADLDPLGDGHHSDPALDPATLDLTPELLAAIPAAAARVYVPGKTLADVFDRLREIYSGTLAYQVEHISNHQQRSWLRHQIESGAHLAPVSPARRLELLDRLTRVEAFERYLRKSFLGQKTFSIEGIDAMVPMLEEMLHALAEDGVAQVDVGMAHRGRLAVITHVVDRPYEEVLEEFEQAESRGVQGEGDVTGDVKYHQGATGIYRFADGKRIDVALANNPSHLEAVDGVVEGSTRAAQTDRSQNIARHDPRRAAAVLVHGDAAFSAQGTVAETLNLSALAGYTTGGTIHIIANNQIGFTTTPAEGRSTRYASDLAKGFDLPIVHVNADDVEACIGAMRLAVAYRRQFGRDVLIDLIGYRRFGHNEADEPAYTQPQMYEIIAKHPTVREIFARRLVSEGVTTEADVKARFDAATKRVAEAHANAKAQIAAARSNPSPAKRPANGSIEPFVDTRVDRPTLERLNQELLAVPDGFTVHPKLARQLQRRRFSAGAEPEIDWGHGETLALASLALDGKAVRLTGQDTERGTFSHRHLVLHDAKTGDTWTPIQHLRGAKASVEVYNSPLSEYACVAFEYGYSAAAPDALVLWEAQFGDFANGAQIIIDQFISAGFAKWGERSRLTLLLPHGYEGAGPEHSSARLERFLQLAAEGNFRIANCTTPAQYFHLLRDQALSQRARPLVIMTPKSLLRLKAAASRLDDLCSHGFATVIDDPQIKDRPAIDRLILCTGKIYYDLTASSRPKPDALAIARIELLEPFPIDDVLGLVASYPNVKRVTWVQEEPRNMGARAFVSRRIREHLTSRGIVFDYVGRPDRASPSEGYPGAHAAEQERIVAAALSAAAQESAH